MNCSFSTLVFKLSAIALILSELQCQPLRSLTDAPNRSTLMAAVKRDLDPSKFINTWLQYQSHHQYDLYCPDRVSPEKSIREQDK